MENRVLFSLLAASAALLTSCQTLGIEDGLGQAFSSPEAAGQSLVAALKSNDNETAARILGPGSDAVLSSGDPVMDKNQRDRFVALYEQKNIWIAWNEGVAVLEIGDENWPFPIPLVNRENGWFDRKIDWRFDTPAKSPEPLNPRVRALHPQQQRSEGRALLADRRGRGPESTGAHLRGGKVPGLLAHPKGGQALRRLLLPNPSDTGHERSGRGAELHRRRRHDGRLCLTRLSGGIRHVGGNELRRQPGWLGLPKRSWSRNRQKGRLRGELRSRRELGPCPRPGTGASQRLKHE